MHMTVGATDGGQKGGRYDRLLSMAALFTGAVDFIGIVFACLDWSHASLTVMRSPSFNLLLFAFSLAPFFVTYLLRLLPVTHEKGRIRYTITRLGGWLALSAIATFAAGYVAGHV